MREEMSEEEAEEAIERLLSDVILDRAEFDKLLHATYGDDYGEINSREIEIAGEKYTIEVLKLVNDGEAPDEMNTHIFVIKEKGGE